MMEVEKKALSFEEIEAQTMLELPERKLLITNRGSITNNQTANAAGGLVGVAANVGVNVQNTSVCVVSTC